MSSLNLTKAQRKALRWLYNRGGEGVFNNHQVLLARGELAGVMRATWNALAKTNTPCIEIYKRRVSITGAGIAFAMSWLGPEASTVEEEDEVS